MARPESPDGQPEPPAHGGRATADRDDHCQVTPGPELQLEQAAEPLRPAAAELPVKFHSSLASASDINILV
jgi:hypothetical protein